MSPTTALVAEEVEHHNSQPINVKWLSAICVALRMLGNSKLKYREIMGGSIMAFLSLTSCVWDLKIHCWLMRKLYTTLWIIGEKLKTVFCLNSLQTSMSRLDAAPHWVTWQWQRLLNRFNFLFPVTLAITTSTKVQGSRCLLWTNQLHRHGIKQMSLTEATGWRT